MEKAQSLLVNEELYNHVQLCFLASIKAGYFEPGEWNRFVSEILYTGLTIEALKSAGRVPDGTLEDVPSIVIINRNEMFSEN